MKKIILSMVLFAGISLAVNAQSDAAGNSTTGEKPKAVVQVAKPEANTSTTGTTASDTTKSSSTTTEKKCAKKSCCKKGGDTSEACDKSKTEGTATDKKKADATTKKE